MDFFLTVIWCRARNRQAAVRLPAIPSRRMAATISSRVKSGCLATSSRSQAACASNGDVLPPLGLAATLPNRTNRCIHRTAELTLTSNRSAASRRDAPASMHSTTRARRSNE